MIWLVVSPQSAAACRAQSVPISAEMTAALLIKFRVFIIVFLFRLFLDPLSGLRLFLFAAQAGLPVVSLQQENRENLTTLVRPEGGEEVTVTEAHASVAGSFRWARLRITFRSAKHWRPDAVSAMLGAISNVTQILKSIQHGDPQAAEQLLPLIYDELRKLAAQKMACETPGQTLQPTALVHEAWLRLTGPQAQNWDSSGHFFGAAAEAMRRILIENARRKQRLKHGGGWQRVDFDNVDVAIECSDAQVLAVDEALAKLEALDKPSAELIKLRFFAGLSNLEAARALGMPERTAKRRWAYARAWLYDELKRSTQ